MGFSVNDGHEGEESEDNPICPGCGKRHPPEDTKFVGINMMDLIKEAAQALDGAPKKDLHRMVAGLVGTFAENISNDVWEEMLLTPVKPCGHPECECHLAVTQILRELHKLKVMSDDNKDMTHMPIGESGPYVTKSEEEA
jgi:hypothetical protein